MTILKANHGATQVVASTMVELVETGAMVAAEMELDPLMVDMVAEMETLVDTIGNVSMETPVMPTVAMSK